MTVLLPAGGELAVAVSVSRGDLRSNRRPAAVSLIATRRGPTWPATLLPVATVTRRPCTRAVQVSVSVPAAGALKLVV